MIDIHSHILPNVDDGSPSAKDSLEMLKECNNQGVTDIILTPHYRREMKTSAEELFARFEEFKKLKEKENIPVNIYLGQEIFYSEDVKRLAKRGEVLTLNSSKYILLEFDYQDECDIAEIAYEFTLSGFCPVIAHIERYLYVTLNTVAEIKSIGGLIQINSSSVLGDCGKKQSKLIKKMLKYGFVDIVASDYHSIRKNTMQEAYKKISSKYGDEIAEKLFTKNAEKILGRK